MLARLTLAAVVVLGLLLGSGPALAASPPVSLSLTGPSGASPGERITYRTVVKTRSRRAQRGLRLELLLSSNRRRDARDRVLRRASALRTVTAKVPRRKSSRATLPAVMRPGRYFVLACVAARPVRKRAKPTPRCAARALRVRRRAASPPGPVATPAPVPPRTGPAGPPTVIAPPAPNPAPPAPTPAPPTTVGDPPAPGPRDAPPRAPSDLAPALAAESATSLLDASRFIYTGADPIQRDVADGVFSVRRAAVLRGQVDDRAGAPIAGARVTVADHPEYGRTATRADGGYDLVVNGGGPLTLVIEREGYIPAQRMVDVPWQDYATVDPLVLVAYDEKGTRLETSGAGVSVAQGTTVTDDAGTRTQSLLFEAGTVATMEVGGQMRPLGGALTVRSTEFTQGARGVEAMPAQLPPTTAYTYAAEFSVDEAVAAGATDVRFSKPVAAYVENILGLAVGQAVPAGSYDRQREEWVGAPNGRVVKLVSGGVDTDGDGTADNTGIDAAERDRVLGLYPPGTELWRVEIDHFTPWDFNYPYGPPGDAGPPGPGVGPPNAPPPGDPCAGQGSTLLCDTQVLGEELPIAGTAQQLVYRSDRVPGRRAERQIPIRLIDGALPASLEAIDTEVSVAGRTVRRSFTAAQATADPVYTFEWDGRDAYGRRVNGGQLARVEVAYRYRAVIQDASAFRSSWARLSGRPVRSNPARTAISLPKRATVRLEAFDARGGGLGGWTLSDHHEYDPLTRTLRLGDGRDSAVEATRLGSLENVAATPAFDGPSGIAIAPDGATWVADTRRQQVRRIALDGAVTVIAGSGAFGYRQSDDGGPATAARLSSPEGIAVVDAGAGRHVAYVADTRANRVRRIGTDGTITTVAGGGASLGDDGPATEARLSGPTGVVVSPDGTLYIADQDQHRVRAVGTDGRITTVAGDGAPGSDGDGGPASGARLRGPSALAMDADGRLLVADTGNDRVRRIDTGGRIETIAGGGSPAEALGDGGRATAARLVDPGGVAVAADGDVLIADSGTGRVRAVTEDGTIRTIAGGGTDARAAGVPAGAVDLADPVGLAVAGDRSIVFSEPVADRVTRVKEPLPGFTDGDALIASEDGGQLFQFDRSGRHLRTLDALTGAVLRRFSYDAQGRLATVHDDAVGEAQPHSPLLTVDRSNASSPVLVTRGGRRTRLALDGAGWLDSVTNPAGEVHQLTHEADGLLRGEADPVGAAHTFVYDGLGRLTRDTNPDGVVKTLSREAVADGFEVTLATTGGQVTRYRTVSDGRGGSVRTVTDPAGAATVLTRRADGTLRLLGPSGATTEQRLAPDPRFGLQAPYVSSSVGTTPGGRIRTTGTQRTVVMRDATRLQTSTQTVTVDGNVSTQTFTARPGDAGGTLVLRSPEGRVSTSELDDHGRITRSRAAAGILDTVTDYDDAADGRIASQTRGARSWTYAYDARHRITRRTGTDGRATVYTYDDADRMVSSTVGGKTTRIEFDAAGDRTGLRTPGDRRTAFTQTLAGLASTMTLPGTARYARSFDPDDQLTSEELPSGARTGVSYDPQHRVAGRTDRRSAGGSAVTDRAYTYVGATSRLAQQTRSAPGVPTETIDTTYDAGFPTKISFAGPAAGSFAYTRAGTSTDTGSVEVTAGNGAPRAYAVTRDRDRLVTRNGPFTVARDAQTGAAETFLDAADGTTVESTDTEGHAELDRRRVLKGATSAYDLTVERDGGGRVTRRTEAIAGGPPVVRTYGYDELGRLVTVGDGGGTTLEAYAYDDDGNRTSADSEDHAAEAATYDAATKLQTAAGPLTMTFDQDGFLARRGGDDFTYSPNGDLLRAQAGAVSVDYVFDATNRLVRREAGGDETSYLYGNPENPFEVTATVDDAGELTTYFYDGADHLHAIERGGTRYRVGADQVGTPRVVMDASGAIVKRVDRDTYGRVLADSAPAFALPIGYAGGIEDPDTGLVRFGRRDYDPQTGRFTARDPTYHQGSPRNLHAYADSAPSARRDPSGLESITVGFFFGVGGSFTYAQGADGSWSICTEAGIGLGISGEVDPGAQPSNGQSVVSEVGAGLKAGPIDVGGSFGAETKLRPGGDTNPCPPTAEERRRNTTYTGKLGATAAGQGVTGSLDSTGTGGVQFSSAAVDFETPISAKSVYKDCVQMKGSLW